VIGLAQSAECENCQRAGEEKHAKPHAAIVVRRRVDVKREADNRPSAVMARVRPTSARR
jgi:hypothetical protein